LDAFLFKFNIDRLFMRWALLSLHEIVSPNNNSYKLMNNII